MALIKGVIGVKDCLCEMKTEVLNMEKMQAFFQQYYHGNTKQSI